MNTVDTPSELLTRAADLIRDRAAVASPGPWTVEPTDMTWDISGDVRGEWLAGRVQLDEATTPQRPTSCYIQHSNGSFGDSCGCCSEGTIAPPDGDWIVLLNPSIAPALELWLRHAAEMVKPFDQGYTTSAYCAERGALAFAHALLGLDTPEEAK